ncbi:hypothetical protein H0H93_013674 [Arthromyces matolae]|nr:hypothetical protein H0H93_014095 [Arthromyces matolae]KAG6831787.1 hypothetical protein H0H93_013683 [Arthromyces matolae]KAG6831789.1 hypothetical protein H0H93_013674 [Arthromyces matolae]
MELDDDDDNLPDVAVTVNVDGHAVTCVKDSSKFLRRNDPIPKRTAKMRRIQRHINRLPDVGPSEPSTSSANASKRTCDNGASMDNVVHPPRKKARFDTSASDDLASALAKLAQHPQLFKEALAQAGIVSDGDDDDD